MGLVHGLDRTHRPLPLPALHSLGLMLHALLADPGAARRGVMCSTVHPWTCSTDARLVGVGAMHHMGLLTFPGLDSGALNAKSYLWAICLTPCPKSFSVTVFQSTAHHLKKMIYILFLLDVGPHIWLY